MSPVKKRLLFNLLRTDTLNSNSMPSHHIMKSKIASALRRAGAEAGVSAHSHPEEAAAYLEYLTTVNELLARKGRTRKRMNKAGASEEEINEQMSILDAAHAEVIALNGAAPAPPYLFEKFTVRVTVCAPTRRRMDPPNFYPTVKALIDGLTDAGWWEDDNFSQLLEMSFRYGGLSGKSDTFTLIVDIEECDDIDFITAPEEHHWGEPKA